MNQLSVAKRSGDTATVEIPMLINGAWRNAAETYEVIDPYRKTVVCRAPRSSQADLDDALNAAVAAKAKAAAMPAYERAALLRRAAKLLVERADSIAEIMARETGKAVKDAKAEIVRSQDTLSLSAEEAVRIEGEHIPLDASAMGAGKICFMLRFPVGVVAGITPFNAPVNLACHKIAPSIAAGNALVLKAPPQCPGVIHALAQIFVDLTEHLIGLDDLHAKAGLAKQRLPQPMHRACAHASLEARAEINTEAVRRLMMQRGRQSFS